MGIAERLKKTVVEYGVVATGFHVTAWISTWFGVHMAVKYGCDVGSLFQQIPFVGDVYDPEKHKDGGELLASYLLTMTTGPARGLATIAVAPPLTVALRQRGFVFKLPLKMSV